MKSRRERTDSEYLAILARRFNRPGDWALKEAGDTYSEEAAKFRRGWSFGGAATSFAVLVGTLKVGFISIEVALAAACATAALPFWLVNGIYAQLTVHLGERAHKYERQGARPRSLFKLAHAMLYLAVLFMLASFSYWLALVFLGSSIVAVGHLVMLGNRMGRWLKAHESKPNDEAPAG